MNETSLKNAIVEAARFTKAACIAIAELKADQHYGGKETAAVKRASMDLTRALAEVRRVG